ncbi:MAG: anchor protein [Phycisphaerales bacterium]|nr:anchor protein [Phycisphaerales bacterium]
MSKCTFALLAAAAAGLLSTSAQAGFYKTITPDGDASEWASVPVATTVSANTGTPIDFASLKIANDATNVYFLITYNTAVNPQSGSGVFTAIDSDNSGATGYNIFGNAAIGSNFGFQNDFPFTESAGNFNSGGTVVGASYGASPYAISTTFQEIAVPRTASQTDASTGGYSGLVFTPTFTVEFYSTDGAGDTLGPISYSLASVPEPTTLGMLSLAALPLMRRRRVG